MKKLVGLIPFLEIIWSVHVSWVSNNFWSAFLWEVSLFPILADQLVKSFFVKICWLKSLCGPPFDAISVLIKGIGEEWVPFNTFGWISLIIFEAFSPVISA